MHKNQKTYLILVIFSFINLTSFLFYQFINDAGDSKSTAVVKISSKIEKYYGFIKSMKKMDDSTLRKHRFTKEVFQLFNEMQIMANPSKNISKIVKLKELRNFNLLDNVNRILVISNEYSLRIGRKNKILEAVILLSFLPMVISSVHIYKAKKSKKKLS